MYENPRVHWINTQHPTLTVAATRGGNTPHDFLSPPAGTSSSILEDCSGYGEDYSGDGEDYSGYGEDYSGDGEDTHNLMTFIPEMGKVTAERGKIIEKMGKRHSQLDEDYSGDGEGTLTT